MHYSLHLKLRRHTFLIYAHIVSLAKRYMIYIYNHSVFFHYHYSLFLRWHITLPILINFKLAFLSTVLFPRFGWWNPNAPAPLHRSWIPESTTASPKIHIDRGSAAVYGLRPTGVYLGVYLGNDDGNYNITFASGWKKSNGKWPYFHRIDLELGNIPWYLHIWIDLIITSLRDVAGMMA